MPLLKALISIYYKFHFQGCGSTFRLYLPFKNASFSQDLCCWWSISQWGQGHHKIFFIFVIWWFQRIVLVKIRLQNDFLSVLNDKKGLKKTRKVWDSNPQPQFHWKLLHKNVIFKVNFLIEHAGVCGWD